VSSGWSLRAWRCPETSRSFRSQALATLIAVYGVFMTPLGWGWALFVWGYALAWFLVNDQVKLLAYRLFDPVKSTPGRSDATAGHAGPSVAAGIPAR
jgi:H+-transporting ATPase